ncbi:hypothetical protein Msip34_1975 [Methylovorus glucosotrophus SIP3-4]|uniref:Uncharacterized protein n=1 Tax=Methylovorus glucosotrophus (strain SIP3-4) TaxID=582744 RepID=C6X774_METGS|nr:hypothetical protein Msip34_1975 [Methylovorus glucosotrophus SIP3-4]
MPSEENTMRLPLHKEDTITMMLLPLMHWTRTR